MLGIRPGYAALEIDPCIPSVWPGFKASRIWRGATYEIAVENPRGVEKGVKSIFLNGKPVRGPVPAQPQGSVNEVVVVMG